MCFWRPVGVGAGEVGAPLEFTPDSPYPILGSRPVRRLGRTGLSSFE